MKKEKYITNPYIYIMMIALPVLSGIICLICKEFYGSIVCFIIALVYSLPFVIFRRKFFSKMIIDENGIRVFYKHNVIKELLWENIKEVQATPTSHGGQISFTDTSFYRGKEKWKNWDGIFVNLNSDFAIELYKYKDKIPVEIKDLDKLPKDIINRLK